MPAESQDIDIIDSFTWILSLWERKSNHPVIKGLFYKETCTAEDYIKNTMV